jgi:hypothetical protein
MPGSQDAAGVHDGGDQCDRGIDKGIHGLIMQGKTGFRQVNREMV